MTDIPSWAHPGAKVVCINAVGILDPGRGYDNETTPVEQAVYTIREVCLPDGATPCLLLIEIRNRVRDYTSGSREFSFMATRFRPAVAPKTEAEDVALFKTLVTTPALIDG